MHQRWLWLLAGAFLGACFSPNYLSGKTACSAAGQCPSGFQCVAGLCYKDGEGPDLSVDNGGGDMSGVGFADLAGVDLANVCVYDRDHYDTSCVYAP